MLRTNTCGELNISNVSEEVTLSGWVQKNRDLGGMTFVDLRDRYGITQLAFNMDRNTNLCTGARKLGREFVIQISGTVIERSSKNKNIPTGEIEIEVSAPIDQFLVLSEIYYPKGWKITSHPDWEIHPVNTILRGIHIPAGEHHIVMEFIPDDVRYGTFLTWGSTVLLLLFIVVWINHKRKENESLAETI